MQNQSNHAVEMQAYSITWRGTFPIGEWNRFIHKLNDLGVKYKYYSYMSKTRDDAGLPIYYERLHFWMSRDYIHNDQRKQVIKWSELEGIIRNCQSNLNGGAR